MRLPRPCSAAEAVARVRALLADPSNAEAEYGLGDGDYHPGWTNPWTKRRGDCRVPFLWGYEIPADRPQYNIGAWATVSDCVNYNSLLEDADHEQDLVVPVTDNPQEGDVIAYPTFTIVTHENGVDVEHKYIGHGAVVVGVSRATAWDPSVPKFQLLDIVQVCGPAGRKPAAIATDGAAFDRHNLVWPKPQHRARLLRAKPS